MATRIRLRRVGRKGQSYFRIVIADQRSPRDGRFVTTIRPYNPRTNPADLKVDAEQARASLRQGGLPTATARARLKKGGGVGERAPLLRGGREAAGSGGGGAGAP